MNGYTEFTDTKGRDARIRVQLNHAQRAKSHDFDGTQTLSKYELRARMAEARCTNERRS